MFSKGRCAGYAAALVLAVLPANAQIESAGLDDVDSWGVSLLERGEQSLGDQVWSGSDGDYLLELLNAIDVDQLTVPERDVLSRALRSPANGLRGDDAAAVLAKRLDLLVALGEDGAASKLARQFDEPPEGFDGDAILSDRRLANGDLDVVCRQMDPAAEGAFWAQLRAICTLSDEDYAAAELSIEIAAQQEGVEPWFSETAIAVLAESEDLPDARYGSGLEIALSQLAGLPITEDTIDSMTPEIAAEIAGDEDIDLTLRLMAASKAAAAGALNPKAHRRLYADLIETEGFEPETAIEAAFVVLAREPEAVPEPEVVALAQSTGGPRDLRAMNEDWIEPVQPEDVSPDALEAETVDEISLAEEQALAVSEALRQAGGRQDELLAVARLLQADLGQLAINEDTRFAAIPFAAALLSVGDQAGAVRWLDGLDEDEISNVDAFDAALLRGYADIGGAERSAEAARAVADTLLETGIEPGQQEQALRLMSLWSGFDMPMPVRARMVLADADLQSRRIASGKMVAIEAAARNDAPGEALFSLLGETRGQPQQLSGADLQDTIEVLRLIDAEDEAQQLALEAGEIWKLVRR
ncbi:hypothetical protein WNY37_02820 [Henriciella sp. AS95]|uniref:hypothetical protein n=1 Tax=Henriciella sp. AS95 TaxID=3135782 RepID=UPI00316B2912